MPAKSSPHRKGAVGKGARLQIDHEFGVVSKYCWGEKRTTKRIARVEGGGGVCGNRQHAWAVIKSNQIIIIQKCAANCVYRFFRTVQLTFAVCRDADRDSDGDGDSDVAVDSGQSNNYQWQQTSSHEAALPSSSIATPTPALRLRLGLPHTQPGDFRININLCAQLKP